MGKVDRKFVNRAIEQYKENLVNKEFFCQQNGEIFPKGSLIKKKSVKRGKNNKIYKYDAYYLEVTVYENKKRRRVYKYIRKSEVESIKLLILKRNKFKRGLRELNAKYRPWERMVKRYIDKGLVDLSQILIDVNRKVKNRTSAINHRKRKFAESKSDKNFKVYTCANDIVRSKNEGFVADYLHSENIDYMYEYKLNLKSRKIGDYTKQIVLKPDFTIFTDKGVFYIEFLGKMDDEDYSNEWQRRKTEYDINGIKIGKNLICFSCSDAQEINCNKLKQVIHEIKLGNIPQNIVNLSFVR